MSIFSNSRQNYYSSSISSSATRDVGLRDYMLKVYNFMAIALAISGATAFLVASSPQLMNRIFGTQLRWVAIFAPIAFVFFFSFKLQYNSSSTAKNYLWAYSALMGVYLASLLIVYTGASVARVFFITASVFGAMSIYGYTTKKDLTNLGSFLIMGLIGVIIASAVNLFLKSPALYFTLSILGTLIFIGLTAYDVQKIKQNYYLSSGDQESINKSATIGALVLYMDFINLFIHLLQLIGNKRD
jgi:FtsH-binding integral membrane protein